jgi:hypothetical protein
MGLFAYGGVVSQALQLTALTMGNPSLDWKNSGKLVTPHAIPRYVCSCGMPALGHAPLTCQSWYFPIHQH